MSNLQKTQVSGSIYDAVTTTSKNQLGRTVEFEDGRKYVYCSTATVFAAGEVVAAPAATSIEANLLAVAAIGATEVVLTLAGVTANLYADGYLMMTDDTGQGYSYRIRKNSASAATTNYVTITLYDPLKVAIDTTTDCVIVKNLHSLVIQGSATGIPLGVAMVPTTGASSSAISYFWVQTRGPALALMGTNTSIAVGAHVCAAASGGIAIATGTTATTIGFSLAEAEDAGGFQPVYLTLG